MPSSNLFAAASFLMIASVLSGDVGAATQSVTVNMTFDLALTLTKNADIQFGILKALTAGTYTIDTNGVVTPSAGGVIIGGTPAFGQITITGSGFQTIAIHTGTYSAATGGVTISAATCNYNGVAIANCDAGSTGLAAPTASGKVLKLGVKAVADGSQAAGATPAPTFVVTVVYG